MSIDINDPKLVPILEELWNNSLSRARDGVFTTQDEKNIRNILENIEGEGAVTITREVAKLLWFIPQFMEWQIDGVANKTCLDQEYRNLCSWDNDRICYLESPNFWVGAILARDMIPIPGAVSATATRGNRYRVPVPRFPPRFRPAPPARNRRPAARRRYRAPPARSGPGRPAGGRTGRDGAQAGSPPAAPPRSGPAAR
jgi:hypothetical protein